jgi:hypothetical protein
MWFFTVCSLIPSLLATSLLLMPTATQRSTSISLSVSGVPNSSAGAQAAFFGEGAPRKPAAELLPGKRTPLQDAPAGGHLLHRRQELPWRHVLGIVGSSARAQRADHLLFVVVSGEHDHGDARQLLAKPPSSLQPVKSWHVHIQDDDVRPVAARLPQPKFTGIGFSHHLYSGLALQDVPQPLAKDRVVIHYEHADLPFAFGRTHNALPRRRFVAANAPH